MPNTMPGHSMRGKLIEALEGWINATGSDVAQAMTDLVAGDALRDILEARLSYPGLPADMNHFDEDWLGKGQPGKWWWSNYEVEAVLRIGMWSALEARQSSGDPVFITWVCTGAQFEVHVLKSAQQVTVLILTPPPAMDPPENALKEGGPTGPPDDSVLVTRRKLQDPGKHGMEKSPKSNNGPQSPNVEIYNPRT